MGERRGDGVNRVNGVTTVKQVRYEPPSIYKSVTQKELKNVTWMRGASAFGGTRKGVGTVCKYCMYAEMRSRLSSGGQTAVYHTTMHSTGDHDYQVRPHWGIE